MSANIIKGVPIAGAITENLIPRCALLRAGGVIPTLAIVRLGERANDLSYEKGALKRCAAVGIEVRQVLLPEDISEDALLGEIRALNEDRSVHGVLILRPLPGHINESRICDALCPCKDVDGITAGSMAAVYSGSGDGYTPCTAQAVVETLKFYNIPICGKRAAVVGRSLVVGRPVAMLLMRENATVTVCHTATADLARAVREADIVVSAAGQINLITGELLHEGQSVMDVGINYDEARHCLCGDVDHEAAEAIVDNISAVPGGIGAVTTSILAMHVIEAAEKAEKR